MDDSNQLKPASSGRSVLYDITIDPNGYKGSMAFVDNKSPQFFFFNGPQIFNLKPGQYILNSGATQGGYAFNETGTSYIVFTVSEVGEITDLNQPNAAAIGKDKKTLILKTAVVTLDVGSYQGNYNLSADYKRNLSGTHAYTLICYQIYALDCTTNLPAYNHIKDCDYEIMATSWFYFFVDDKGTVTIYDKKVNKGYSDSLFANGDFNTLTLKTVPVWIDPAELSQNNPIQLQNGTTVSSRKEVVFLRGLLTWVKWQPTGIYYFIPL